MTPILATHRLKIDMPSSAEACSVVDFYRRNKEHLHPTNPPLPKNFYEEDFWSQRLAANQREFEADCSVRLFIRERATEELIVGSINFGQIVRGPFQACYLGYSIDKDYEGRGYMREALEAAIEYMFNEKHLHRIMANYLPDNHRSGQLLKRLGFVIDGRSADYLYIHGSWREHVMTSLTNINWTPREVDKAIFF